MVVSSTWSHCWKPTVALQKLPNSTARFYMLSQENVVPSWLHFIRFLINFPFIPLQKLFWLTRYVPFSSFLSFKEPKQETKNKGWASERFACRQQPEEMQVFLFLLFLQRRTSSSAWHLPKSFIFGALSSVRKHLAPCSWKNFRELLLVLSNWFFKCVRVVRYGVS